MMTNSIPFEVCILSEEFNYIYCLYLSVIPLISVHSKQCWVVLTQIWVKYGQNQMLG